MRRLIMRVSLCRRARPRTKKIVLWVCVMPLAAVLLYVVSTWRGSESPVNLFRLEERNDSIFFFETSSLPFFQPKQLCSIESAALHHPNRRVLVGVVNTAKQHPGNTFPPVERLLQSYTNIKVFGVALEAWVKGTVLESWLATGKLQKSKFRVSNTSNLLRYLAILKYGGIYLDLDSLVMKSLDDLRNTVGIQEPTAVNCAVLVFHRDHKLIHQILAAFSARFDGDHWGINGPFLLSTEHKKWCGLPDDAMYNEALSCNGVETVARDAFYPVPPAEWNQMFADNSTIMEGLLKKSKDSYVISFWNNESAATPIRINSSSLLGNLAKKHCPLVSREFGGELWGIRQTI